MEDLKKRRMPVRGIFTKRYDALITALDETEINREDVEIKLSSLERSADDLAKLDESIIVAMIDAKADDFDSEYEKIEEYREKLDAARIRTKICFEKLLNESEVVPSVAEKSKLKLPKIELMSYGGEIKDWLAFWSQFSRIHDDPRIGTEDKFQYLIQCMAVGSRAREIVDGYPPTAENYAKVIDSLKTRFGREELLVEYYVRELLSLVVKNAMNMNSTMSIMQLYDKLESHLRSLESVGVTTDKYAAMLFPLVESCIPESLLRVWLRNPVIDKEKNNSYGDKLSQLLSFLRAEVEGEERISLAKAGFQSKDAGNRKQRYKSVEPAVPTANDLVYGSKSLRACVFCNKAHNSHDCFKAQKMSFSEKQDILRKNKACFVCLKVGHRSKNCKTNVRCMICQGKHWAILCSEMSNVVKIPTMENTANEENAVLSNQSQPEVLLQTLVVLIETGGKSRTVRALLDTGSQRSYVLKSTMSQMKANAERSESLTHVVFGGNSSRRLHKCYKLSVSDLKKNYSIEVQVLDQQVICGYIPSIQEGPWIVELRKRGIHLTDIGKNSMPIELLIGADYMGNLFTGNVCHLPSGMVATETYLGWSIMGKQKVNVEKQSSTSLLIQSSNISDLWSLETIGITDPCETDSSKELEDKAFDHFSKNVKCKEDGRYEIKLPWMRDGEELPSNRDIAGKRLISTSMKLVKGGQFERYDSVFEEWMKKSFIEESSEGPGHYLPHRGVFKDKSTTKVRPVFDASCKARGALSLNDCLMKGPNLLEVIPSVLMRFREGKIGVVSDITKAFLQISVAEEDRKFLKFLWWKNRDQGICRVYQHARVVFGLNCSPFLLSAVINHHLDQYLSTPMEDTAMKLKSAFYVDNCVTSVDSVQELKLFVENSTALMAAAKFDLRGWEFTEEACLSEKPEPTPVLGLLWNKSEDVLFCDNSSLGTPPDIVTRRTILSAANSIFDPIGFSCPVSLCPKLLLQESWQSKLSWDSELPAETKKRFLKWLEDIKLLHLVKIPRQAFTSSDSSLSLNVFCDASTTSYAAAIFIRSQNEYETTVQLLMAKSRIAPLKPITIPRLELLACCIGARLAQFVKESLKLTDMITWFWTDSSTALQWIKRDEPWSVFVRNRVKEIRKLSNIEEWRHVPGSLNPADLPSRGCSVLKLLSSRWWEGPPWLRLCEDSWPKSDFIINEDTVSKEKCLGSSSLVNNSLDADSLFSRFSSFAKIVRILGWILRYYYNSKTKKESRREGNLSVTEIAEAEKRVIRMIQSEAFTEESVKGLKTLNAFRDEEGILRIKTKLTERDDSEDFRYPILLPGKHRFVELIVREAHLQNSHAGVQILLSKLREHFWILNGRRAVRNEINRCLRCKRYNARSIETLPTSLPSDRVKEAAVFEVSGVDLAGPLILKGGEKCWIVLFTCAVYRAVHLELVLSLSTRAFLLSLRRFIARRGRPKVMYSDNGKNFVGAENLL